MLTVAQYIEALSSPDGRVRGLVRVAPVYGPDGVPRFVMPGHALVRCAEALGIETYVSPTTSDWTRIGAIPAIKMGPGDSARSHTPDEYITVDELHSGIEGYIRFLENLRIDIKAET